MAERAPAPALVIIPTYNERESLRATVAGVLEAVPDAHLLVVDDSSPDGTGVIADELASVDHRVHVLHRAEKDGLGAAYVAGFAWALERSYPVIIEMDADGSHPASALPQLIAAVEGTAGLAIGSRWVAGGSIVNWPRSRETISRLGNFYARTILRLRVRDVTAGFRVFRADVLRTIHTETLHSRGYCFQIETTLRVHDAGVTIVEIPIEFREREFGESKMSTGIVVEAMLKVTQWGLARLVSPGRPTPAT
ncbi:polyprenol monophosphomannose synthase [soil metagenome]